MDFRIEMFFALQKKTIINGNLYVQMQNTTSGGNNCEPHKWENTEVPQVQSGRSSLVIAGVRTAPELGMDHSSCKE